MSKVEIEWVRTERHLGKFERSEEREFERWARPTRQVDYDRRRERGGGRDDSREASGRSRRNLRIEF
jgi:hypothetical protein